ncbi:MAG: SDR family oxidoreductase [Pirellulales bacterium]|nr:SDR family oxidoreductase [Pirellulales bacterium]
MTVISRVSGGLDEDQNVTHIPHDFSKPGLDSCKLPEQIDSVAYLPGSINLKPISRLTLEDFSEDLQLNLLGAVELIQACLPGLKRSSFPSKNILLFSTVATRLGMPFHASTVASKSAIEGLTKSLAAELSPQIRVNCVAPGMTKTDLSASFITTPEKEDALARKYPLKRLGCIEDISRSATFLMTEDSDWLTGQIISVDGGLSSLRI